MEVVILVVITMCMMGMRGMQSRVAPGFINVQMQPAGLSGQQTDQRDQAEKFRRATHLLTILEFCRHLIRFENQHTPKSIRLYPALDWATSTVL